MQKQKSLALRFFPALSLLLGLIAIFLLLQVRKEGGALLGYSPSRLALALPDGKISLTQKILVLAGIMVNYWGLWLMFRHWCW